VAINVSQIFYRRNFIEYCSTEKLPTTNGIYCISICKLDNSCSSKRNCTLLFSGAAENLKEDISGKIKENNLIQQHGTNLSMHILTGKDEKTYKEVLAELKGK
jgi:hypothetical protein